MFIFMHLKPEMQENNHLKETVTKSILAYAAKNECRSEDMDWTALVFVIEK